MSLVLGTIGSPQLTVKTAHMTLCRVSHGWADGV